MWWGMADGSNPNFSLYSLNWGRSNFAFVPRLILVSGLIFKVIVTLVSSFGWSNKPAKQGNEIKTKNLSHKNVDPKFFAFLPFNGLLVLKVNRRTLITSKLSEIKIKFSKRDWKYFFQSFFSSLAIWSKRNNKYI